MRSDVILYVVAAIFFALSIISIILFSGTERFIWIILNVALGIISIGSGYYLRPKPTLTIKTISPATAESITPTTTVEPTSILEEPVMTESIPQEPSTNKEPIIEEAPIDETPNVESVPDETSQTIETPETVEPIGETISSPQQEPTPIPTSTQDNKTPIQAEQEETPLTNVKGIGEKRAAQLNALGINTAKELAQTSIDDLAKNLNISPKIAAKLIEAAKQQ